MTYFRKVIVGDTSIAMKHFHSAEAMLVQLLRTGKQKMVFIHPEVTMIAKNIDGFLKVIFITAGNPLFIYVHDVTVGNIARFSGWVEDELIASFSIDFNDIPSPSTIAAIEITDTAEGYFNVVMRTNQSLLQPPVAEYVIEYETLSVAPFRTFTYSGSPVNFRQQHRGIDRDFFYSTTDVNTPGFDAGATIHERFWSDETNTIVPRYVLPASLTNFAWPFVGGDAPFSRYFVPVGNKIWLTEAKVDWSEIYFWVLNELKVLSNISAFNAAGFGGSSHIAYGSMINNDVNDEMRISTSEWTNAAGSYSDVEQLRAITTGFAVELFFSPGDHMGYSGRDVTNYTRINRSWAFAEDSYVFHIENTNQPVSGARPDGIFLSREGVVEMLYQAEPGRRLNSPTLNRNTPTQFLVGEEDRTGGNGKMLLFDLELGTEPTIVTEDTGNLTSDQFVR